MSDNQTEIAIDRDLSIDALRGLAMILVVVGHTLGAAFPATYLSNPAQVVLFSFHLPLFATVAGFVMYGRVTSPLHMLSKRFKALMIPYFAWYIVWWSLSRARGDSTSLLSGTLQVAASPLAPNALWFLYALFLTNMVFALVYAIRPTLRAIKVSLAIAVVLYVSGIFEGIWLLDPKRVSWLYIFFALGYLCAGPWRGHLENTRAVATWGTLLYVGSLAMTATVRADGTRFINLLLGENTYVHVITRILLAIAATSACALLWVIFHRTPRAVLKPFGFFGVRSTGIYATHKRLIYLTLELGSSGFWVPFAIAIAGSTLLTYALERIPLASNVLLGKGPLRTLLPGSQRSSEQTG